ncbi:MAG TPA: GntR family transcriptional regulator [Pseudonocardia sp.]|nr:GntR family transcriptional regulator [Pseudonocardia sp.]
MTEQPVGPSPGDEARLGGAAQPVGPSSGGAARLGGTVRLGSTRQLSERVAAYLREAIMVGELPASEFVRMEHVAARLGVSATPVREALMILQGEGAVRWEPRRGFRVVPLTRQDVDDLFAVQAHVAGELAARAARALSAGEVDRLRAAQDELVAAADRGELDRVGELNHELHRTVNRAARSPRLAAMLNLFVHYVPRTYYGQVDGWADATVRDHAPVLAALAAADPDAARDAMVEHIRHIGRLLIAHLERSGTLPAPATPTSEPGAPT